MAKKIIFMGTPMFAVPILKSLYQNGYPVTCVYTQPPQKSHRGQKINKSPIQGISETLNLEYRAPSTLKENKEEYEFFKSVDADLAIVVAYGQIIPKEFLSLTKKRIYKHTCIYSTQVERSGTYTKSYNEFR
jgi:methionyl-tRNA formyltransferase